MDAYLSIAERALSDLRRPMKPREIIHYAYTNDLLPGHLYGMRQDKTLQARISEDIAIRGEKSRFYRVAHGTFFLEALRLNPSVQLESRERFLAAPRRKSLRREKVLLVDLDLEASLRADKRTLSVSKLLDILDAGNYIYRSIEYAATSARLFAVNSFVVVVRDEYVLSFRCGKFYPHTDPPTPWPPVTPTKNFDIEASTDADFLQ